MKLLDLKPDLEFRRTFGFFDDMLWYISPHLWTSLAVDSGVTAPVGTDAVGGIITMSTGATDNNEVAFKTTNEVFLFADDAPLVCEARIKYAEAATSAANVAFGFADAIGANLLVDDGAGPKTTFSGALIYKVDGGTVWKVISSKSTTQTISTSTTTAGGTSYQTLRIECQPISTTLMDVTFFVDGVQLLDTTTLKPIKHSVTMTSATEMQAGVYLKAGGANSETLLTDYVSAYQLRA